jgi:hypothetical protein
MSRWFSILFSLLFFLLVACQSPAAPTPTLPPLPTPAGQLEPTPTLLVATPAELPPATIDPTSPAELTPTIPPPTTDATAAATPAPTPSALPHYDLAVALDYPNHQATVSETITIPNHSPDSWSEVVLNVSAAYWDGLFSLGEITVQVGESKQTVAPLWDNTMLHIALPNPAAPGTTAVVWLDYRLYLPPLDPVGWGPQGNAGWSAQVTQMGDWYPALVPYAAGRGWQSWPYHPVGDPVRSVVADFDVAIIAPADVLIAAAGFTSESASVRHYRLEQARAFAFLASPHFILLTSQAQGVAIRIYVPAGHQRSGEVVLQTVQQAIDLFTEQFGPYPYPEFVMAENGFLTAMEYSAVVSLSGFAFETYSGTPDSLLVAITAHEVSHQWWYGVVGNDQVEEPWLDESLAMMSELLFYERYYPELVDWWWAFRVDRWQPAGFVDVSVYDYADSPTFVHNMYGVAARFLRDLRAAMGASNFQAFLHDYYQQHSFAWATADTFFAVALNYASKEALRPLVQSYFRQMPAVLIE